MMPSKNEEKIKIVDLLTPLSVEYINNIETDPLTLNNFLDNFLFNLEKNYIHEGILIKNFIKYVDSVSQRNEIRLRQYGENPQKILNSYSYIENDLTNLIKSSIKEGEKLEDYPLKIINFLRRVKEDLSGEVSLINDKTKDYIYIFPNNRYIITPRALVRILLGGGKGVKEHIKKHSQQLYNFDKDEVLLPHFIYMESDAILYEIEKIDKQPQNKQEALENYISSIIISCKIREYVKHKGLDNFYTLFVLSPAILFHLRNNKINEAEFYTFFEYEYKKLKLPIKDATILENLLLDLFENKISLKSLAINKYL